MANEYPYRSAVVQMPTTGQMGGQFQQPPQQQQQQGQVPTFMLQMPPPAPPPPFVQRPFYPTAPFISTNPNVGMQSRYYVKTFSSTDPQYNVGSEANLVIPFDIPARLCALNGAAIDATGAVDYNNYGLNTFLFQASYINDKLVTTPTLASTVLGTAQRPGELGGIGWTIQPGGTLNIGITPLADNLLITIVAVCLEMRAATNYTGGA